MQPEPLIFSGKYIPVYQLKYHRSSADIAVKYRYKINEDHKHFSFLAYSAVKQKEKLDFTAKTY